MFFGVLMYVVLVVCDLLLVEWVVVWSWFDYYVFDEGVVYVVDYLLVYVWGVLGVLLLECI